MLQVPIGYDDFRELRQARRYFVDKSQLIAEFWRDAAKVLLLPRPRRFGKSLNMSMLKYFFSCQHEGRELFQGLSIEQDAEIMAEQGKYPVIALSLKSICGDSFEEAMEMLANLFADLLPNFDDLLKPENLSETLCSSLQQLRAANASKAILQNSLYLLSTALHKSCGQRAIIIIDEYDVPPAPLLQLQARRIRSHGGLLSGLSGGSVERQSEPRTRLPHWHPAHSPRVYLLRP